VSNLRSFSFSFFLSFFSVASKTTRHLATIVCLREGEGGGGGGGGEEREETASPRSQVSPLALAFSSGRRLEFDGETTRRRQAHTVGATPD
jgi:hypothetical protein